MYFQDSFGGGIKGCQIVVRSLYLPLSIVHRAFWELALEDEASSLTTAKIK